MNFCKTSQSWGDRKQKFQTKKLNFLIAIKESYERKLAAVSASISKLEEQINSNSISIDS